MNKVLHNKLDLRPGDIVQVRSPSDIRATLDASGRLDNMPFMPEMLDACGKVFEVYARADKTCDTATRTGGRRLHNTVHLKNERCNGEAHGGCQAACLNFWKESWLERVTAYEGEAEIDPQEKHDVYRKLEQHTHIAQESGGEKKLIYSCQATLLPEYTEPLKWWDLRQYWRDLTKNNVGIFRFFKVVLLSFYSKLVGLGVGSRLLIKLFNSLQRIRGGRPWPRQNGALDKTPTGHLDLRVGDEVRIKSQAEIMRTLNSNNKNRGLRFDAEMARYCGHTYQVHSRVEKIINEATGEMMHFSNPCIILDDVWCRSEWSECRLFCPRSIYSYWREIWLEKISDDSDALPQDDTA